MTYSADSAPAATCQAFRHSRKLQEEYVRLKLDMLPTIREQFIDQFSIKC